MARYKLVQKVSMAKCNQLYVLVLVGPKIYDIYLYFVVPSLQDAVAPRSNHQRWHKVSGMPAPCSHGSTEPSAESTERDQPLWQEECQRR